jgi:two-component system, NarL family, nitrate/nitrite response regulator NarL
MKRLCVVTDEPVLGQGVEATVCEAGGWTTVTIDPADVSTRGLEFQPDIALVDLACGSFNMLLEIGRNFPACKLVLWIHNIEIETAFQAIRYGVAGILRKTDSLQALCQCLDAVGAGQTWLDKALAAAVTNSRCIQLTPRESQLVGLVSDGLKNKEIAQHLCISEGTVRVYMSSLFRKVGVKDRYELALYGLKNMAGNKVQIDAPMQTARTFSFMISKPSAQESGAGQRRAKIV